MPEHRYDMSLHDRMYKTVGQQVRGARHRFGMSQALLASEAGISKDTLIRIESGKPTDYVRLIKVSQALGVAIVLGCDNPEVIKSLENLSPDWRPTIVAKGFKHGVSGYKRGCRCAKCSIAHSEYKKIRKLQKGEKVQAPLPKGWEHRIDMLTHVGTKVNFEGK